MGGQPFYHLRPNKFIDRYLFLQVLGCLSKYLPIHEYRYIGFGSYQFDDFKIVHNQLSVSDMVSLESDTDVFNRANFNKPYKCIDIINETSTSYVSSVELDKPIVAWLDFTDPKQLGSQFSDFCTLLNKMRANDIIRITLNANPSSLGERGDLVTPEDIHAMRFKTLMDRIGGYFPPNSESTSMTMSKYPLFLLSCLKRAASSTLQYAPPYQNNYLFPLFSTVYQDGQQMVTFTAIVLDNQELADEIKKDSRLCPYITYEWSNPCKIQVPDLTSKEVLFINNLLPDDSSIQRIIDEYLFMFDNDTSGETVKNYVRFYKYYPNFHHVNF